MNKIFSIILAISFSIQFCNAQPHSNPRINSAIQRADSIVLISHIITDEYAVIKPDEKAIHNYPLLINGNINPEIILKRVLLNKTQSNNLLTILKRPVNTIRWAPPKCDQPHNSILIYKKAKLSYIDICFDCYRIHLSKELQHTKFAEIDMDIRKWNDIKAFFKKLDVDYVESN